MTTTYKSKFAVNDSCVYVSDYMTGKISGIPAISTSVFLNPMCAKRAKVKGSICEHCFAVATVSRYDSLSKHLEENTAVLTEQIINIDELPQFAFSVGMLRFEAFGDLNNYIQVINYFNIAKKNPHIHAALWTKNPQFIEQAISKGYEKPENLNIIFSSPILNRSAAAVLKRYSFIDKVFTVYDKPTIKENNIDINCGARACGSCGLCYFDKTIKEIREQLK